MMRTTNTRRLLDAAVLLVLAQLLTVPLGCRKSESDETDVDARSSVSDMQLGDDLDTADLNTGSVAKSPADGKSAAESSNASIMEIAAPPDPLPRADVSKLEPQCQKQIDEALSKAEKSPDDPEAVGTVAMLYQAYGLLPEADAWYRRAIQLQPDRFLWRYLLAHTFLSAGNNDEGARVLGSALSIKPDYLPGRIKLTQVFLELGAFDEALAAANDLLQRAPGEPMVEFMAGLVHLARKQYIAAIQHLKPVLDENPTLGGVRQALANAFEGLGQSERSEEILAGVEPNQDTPVISDPQLAQVYRLAINSEVEAAKGFGYMEKKDYWRALKCFDNVLKHNERHVQARLGAADALVAIGDLKAAEPFIRKTLEQNDQLAEAWIQLGDLYLMQERLDDCQKVVDRLAQIAPNHRMLIAFRARLASLRNDFPAAVAQFQQLADISPFNAQVFFELGKAQEAAGQTENAVTTYLHAIELDDKLDGPMYRLGMIFSSQRQFGAAYTWFQRAITAKPSEPQYYVDFAKCASSARDFKSTMVTLRNARETFPDNAEVKLLLAKMLAMCPDTSFRNGAEAVQLATELCDAADGKTPANLDALGAAYAEAGDKEKAIATLQSAARLAEEAKDDTAADAIKAHLESVRTDTPIKQRL